MNKQALILAKLITNFLILALFAIAQPGWTQSNAPLLKQVSPSAKEWSKSLENSLASRKMNAPGGRSIAVAVNASRLEETQVNIDLPNGTSISVPNGVLRRLPTHVAWTGQTNNNDIFASFILSDGKLTGNVRVKGVDYRIEPTADRGVSIVSEMPRASEKRDDPPTPPTPPPVLQKMEEEYQRSKGKTPQGPADVDASLSKPIQLAATASIATIDIMVVTSPTARILYGGEQGLTTGINNHISNTNRILSNSGIAAELRLVEIFPLLTFYEDSNAKLDVALKDYSSRRDVIERRNFVGADIVVLMAGTNVTACGIAYAPPNQATAYAVVAVDIINCPESKFSFAHEVGHLIGGDHNITDAYVKSGSAHGWPDANDQQIFVSGNPPLTEVNCSYTVMAYSTFMSQSCLTPTRIPYFSSPSRFLSTQVRGVRYAAGSAIANNTAALISNVAAVSAYRGSGSNGNQTSEYIKRVSKLLQDIIND
ncbi:zinc-dependent metalloprotease family protein [Roseateles sp. UC29_93]|uniref:zinc-dependent metalloprotease family protein n=1 Tax=Roseateles sp. UC29_93 TaxID=3350177 RepID=UPI00366E4CF3